MISKFTNYPLHHRVQITVFILHPYIDYDIRMIHSVIDGDMLKTLQSAKKFSLKPEWILQFSQRKLFVLKFYFNVIKYDILIIKSNLLAHVPTNVHDGSGIKSPILKANKQETYVTSTFQAAVYLLMYSEFKSQLSYSTKQNLPVKKVYLKLHTPHNIPYSFHQNGTDSQIQIYQIFASQNLNVNISIHSA